MVIYNPHNEQKRQQGLQYHIYQYVDRLIAHSKEVSYKLQALNSKVKQAICETVFHIPIALIAW